MSECPGGEYKTGQVYELVLRFVLAVSQGDGKRKEGLWLNLPGFAVPHI